MNLKTVSNRRKTISLYISKLPLVVFTVILFFSASFQIFPQFGEPDALKAWAQNVSIPDPGAGAGPPVKDDKQEALCRDFIRKAGRGEDISCYCGKVFTLYPGLWFRMRERLEPGTMWKPLRVMVSSKETGNSQELDGAGFTGGHVKRILRSKAMIEFFKKLESGTVRPANQRERDLFYRLVCWELKGKPVTVVQSGPDVVVFYGEEGKFFVMDLLNIYRHRDGSKMIEDKNEKIEDVTEDEKEDNQ